jgi:hypothetical protein
MTALVTAVEVAAYDPALPGVTTLYYSSGRLITTTTDTPPHIAFDDRILSAPNFVRRAFGNARVTSGGQASGGVLELANPDHALAALLDLGLDGRAIVVRVGIPGTAYPAAWTTWLSGTVEQLEVRADRAVLRIRDRTAILDQPLQATRYAGTNSLPNGAEGVATDIKGQPKPLAWGRCYQVPAVLVNTAMLTYQVHSGAMQAIDAVCDKGAALTFGADRANLAALEAAAIAAGSYDTCLALGLFRLGASPAGRITADIRGDAAGSYVDRAGAIARRILETVCAIPTGEIDTASITALDAVANYQIGIWIGAETTRRAVIDALLGSVGAWCLPDREGIWTAGRLVAPPGAPLATYADAEIDSIDREATNDPGRGIPAWQVTLRYRRNWAPASAADLVPVGAGMTEARRNDLQQEWRATVASDSGVQTAHLLATSIEADTLLTTEADAIAEAARRLALHSVRRDYVRLHTPLTDDSAQHDLGDELRAVTPALGYAAGRNLVVLGITREGDTMIFEMWG